MPFDHEETAATIWRLWQASEVIAALPAARRPQTRAEGYAAQAVFETCSAKPRYGWKIAATSTAGQKHIGVSGPLAGRLLAERIYQPGASISIAGNRMRVCEPEFGFRIATDLPPQPEPYTVDAVMAAVAGLHLTLELPDSRFEDFAAVGEASLIADNACARDLVVGPAVSADWPALDLSAHEVSASVAGRYDRAGIGRNVLGDPRLALTWLVNEVMGQGITIAAGELVTTGTCMPPLEIEPGDKITADFGVLGRIGVEIAS